MKKLIVSAICLIIILPIFGISRSSESAITVILCRPLTGQIKNIEILYEKDIIKVNQLKLICLYHENEVTNYQKARQYVKDNNLDWIQFKTIKGMEKEKNIFKNNKWTSQFLELFNESKGIIFTGGMDLPPSIYQEKTNILTEPFTPVRSYYETSFLFHLIGSSRNTRFTPFLKSNPQYAIIGLCLGCQTMNVAAGGTLYQDIPTQIYKLKSAEDVLKLGQDRIHSGRYIRTVYPMAKNLPPAFHKIKLIKNSIFEKLMEFSKTNTPLILTSHHQALNKIGLNLKIAATSMDGKIVEAIQHTKFKSVLGVQFHPEYSSLYLKGRFFKKKPEGKKNFNLRSYLQNNHSSMKFHHKIWAWFSRAISY